MREKQKEKGREKKERRKREKEEGEERGGRSCQTFKVTKSPPVHVGFPLFSGPHCSPLPLTQLSPPHPLMTRRLPSRVLEHVGPSTPNKQSIHVPPCTHLCPSSGVRVHRTPSAQPPAPQQDQRPAVGGDQGPGGAVG